MNRKKLLKTVAIMVMAALIACSSTVPAFAYVDENPSVISPEGNLSLVDDLNYDEASGLQFMTVTTKDGHYFYIVIDRSGNSENVYFLNLVDEVDLMELMNDEEKSQFEEEKDDPPTQVLPVVDNTDKPLVSQEEASSPSYEKSNGTASLAQLGIFVAIGIAITVGYYFLKVKPKNAYSGIDEDREFYDDDDYENEEDEKAEEIE